MGEEELTAAYDLAQELSDLVDKLQPGQEGTPGSAITGTEEGEQERGGCLIL